MNPPRRPGRPRPINSRPGKRPATEGRRSSGKSQSSTGAVEPNAPKQAGGKDIEVSVVPVDGVSQNNVPQNNVSQTDAYQPDAVEIEAKADAKPVSVPSKAVTAPSQISTIATQLPTADSSRRAAAVLSGRDEKTVSQGLTPRLKEKRRARRITRLKTISIAFVLAVLISSLIWLVGFSSVFSLRGSDLKITGLNEHISEEQVQSAVAPFVGTPLLRISADKVSESIKAESIWVRSVQMSRAWPNGLDLTITSRTPVAVSKVEEALHLVDAEGIDLGEFVSEDYQDLPQINVSLSGAQETKPNLLAALSLAEGLPIDLRENVMSVDAKEIDSLVLIMKNGQNIIWGKNDDLELKIKVLRLLLSKETAYVDVSDPRRPSTW